MPNGKTLSWILSEGEQDSVKAAVFLASVSRSASFVPPAMKPIPPARLTDAAKAGVAAAQHRRRHDEWPSNPGILHLQAG